MPVVGANQIKARMKSFVSDVSDKKAMQFVNSVVAQAGILSEEKAPIEYGTLINSKRIDVVKNASRVTGSLSYNTLYASILNDGKYKWKPRAPANKKGPAWNPNATPRFLEYGFESKEGQANLAKYLEIFKI